MRKTAAAAATGMLALFSAMPGSGSAGAHEPAVVELRIAWDGPGDLDPAVEYDYNTWEIYTSLLIRTLVSYRHVAGVEGTELVPDLATEVPQPTDDGLTYTFGLKPGVMFGPPLNRPVTSQDIKYAFKRMVCRFCLGSYSFYYEGVIEGMRARDGKIEGIETPDNDTIVFRLTEPTGDFLHRLALPATGPIPPEVARCFRTHGYGRRLIATGPYMLKGSESLNVSNGCDAMKPISGFQHRAGNLRLVRNPNYDPATDSSEVREPFLERFTFLRMTEQEAFRQIEEESLDGALLTPSRRRVARYAADASDHPVVHSHLNDVVFYVTMNLTQPPFDDVHVRRALSYAIDKPAALDAWGGDAWADVATHILTPTLTGGHPTAAEADRYDTLDGADLDRARAEMAQSRYDRNDDGLCDAPACETVTLVNRREEPWRSAEQHVVAALEAIGISPGVRQAEWVRAYDLITDMRNRIELGMNPGWGKDYADASTVLDPLFHSRTLKECYSFNYARVGGTPAIKDRCDAPGDYSDLPNVDADIEACMAIGDETARDECWIGLDDKLMDEIVPWVPLVWTHTVRVTRPGVAACEFDQFTGEVSLAHISASC